MVTRRVLEWALGGVLVITLSTAALAAPARLAPGPWHLAKQATASGRNPELHLFARWSQQTEPGPSIGETTDPPTPRRVAVVIDEPRTQRARLGWTAICYPDRVHGYSNVGVATAIGRRFFYPRLYSDRVECDLYVNAKAEGPGTMTLRIYGY
jgi:hypothetical protein